MAAFYLFLIYLLDAISKFSVILFFMPLLFGVGIMLVGNLLCKIRLGKFPSLVWNLLAALITIGSTMLLWVDVFNDSVNTAAAAFIIPMIFVFVSLVWFAVALSVKTLKRKGKEDGTFKS